MLTLASNDFVRRYVKHSAPAMQVDLLEVIAPKAELVGNLGIPYFQQNATWLYGVAARPDHL